MEEAGPYRVAARLPAWPQEVTPWGDQLGRRHIPGRATQPRNPPQGARKRTTQPGNPPPGAENEQLTGHGKKSNIDEQIDDRTSTTKIVEQINEQNRRTNI